MIRNLTILSLSALLLFSFSLFSVQAQEENTISHKIVKQNGVAFIGKIISQDAREILLDTQEIGLVYIPKHEIKEIIILDEGEKYDGGGLFSTRYFLTTNGFPVKKGENYIQWNIFGPDFQFGVADNFGLGIMTSWVGLPIIGTAKYSRQIADKVSGGVGFLGGTGSWAFPRYGLLLPFGFLTFGDRVNNINFTAGYGALFVEESEPFIINQSTDWSTNYYETRDVSKAETRLLLSVAGMFKMNSKFSFVFDSFFMLPGKEQEYNRIDQSFDENTKKETYFLRTESSQSGALLVLSPGLRFQANENSSFQFGFTGVYIDGEFLPVPIPMVQWFRAI